MATLHDLFEEGAMMLIMKPTLVSNVEIPFIKWTPDEELVNNKMCFYKLHTQVSLTYSRYR